MRQAGRVLGGLDEKEISGRCRRLPLAADAPGLGDAEIELRSIAILSGFWVVGQQQHAILGLPRRVSVGGDCRFQARLSAARLSVR